MLPSDTIIGRLGIIYVKDAVTSVVIMVLESINAEVFHVLKLLQVPAMTMTLHNEFNAILRKQIRQLVGFLKWQIGGVPLRLVFLPKMSVGVYDDMSVVGCFRFASRVFEPIHLKYAEGSRGRVDEDT